MDFVTDAKNSVKYGKNCLQMGLFAIFLCVFANNLHSQKACLKNPDAVAQIQACTESISKWQKKQGNPRLAVYYRSRAIAHTKEKRYQNAVEDVEKALSLDPDNAQNFLLRGWIYNRFGYYDRAIDNFYSVTKLTPKSRQGAWAYYNLAISYHLQGKKLLADKHLNAAKEIMPQLYEEYLKELEYFNARERAQKDRGKQNFIAALRSIKDKDYQQAEKSILEAIKIEPSNSDYINWLGSVYFEMADYEKAINVFTNVPQEKRWNYYLGLAFVARNELENAKQAFDEAVNDSPEKNRGQDIKEKAEKYAQRLKDYLFYLNEAQAAANRGDHKASIESVDKALANLKIKKARDLKESQTKIYDAKQKAKKRLPWIILLVIVAMAFLIMILTIMLKVIKARFQKKGSQEKKSQPDEAEKIAQKSDDILNIKPPSNTLDSADIPTVPESLDTKTMQAFFHKGYSKKVAEYILKQSETERKPEFYFYLFAYFGKIEFSQAWAHYEKFSTTFEVGSNVKTYYGIALLCELFSQFNKALEIYDKITLNVNEYQDVRHRRLYIQQLKGEFIKPSAHEMLEDILPSDFFTDSTA